ncbi:hypothetical protein AWV79_13375 [Cupriavidus sp. UYMMa02A]|nr:hypothetical protein AWV79_13375 [Cupriavidus sp. UYMMa02A]
MPAGISSLSEYIEHHRAGRFRILAASGTTRPEVAPDIPTFKELGLTQLDVNPWAAFVGPKGLPPEFADRFSKAVAVSLASPEIKEKFRRLGNVATYASVADLQQRIAEGSRHWGACLVKQASRASDANRLRSSLWHVAAARLMPVSSTHP